MRGKLLFVAGAAVGYVLGARAGRKRYEQIKSAASKVWESPGVQKQVDQVEDFVAAKVGDIPGVLYEGAKKLIVQASNRRSDTTTSTTAVQPAAPKPAAKKPATKPAAAKPAAAKPAGAKPAAAKSAAAKPTTAAKPAAAKPSTRSTPAKKPASSTGDTDA